MNQQAEYDLITFEPFDLSIALTSELDEALADHFDKGGQEDLTFAYWKPSHGRKRYTAVINKVVFPYEAERILQGNVAFTTEYLSRVLDECPKGYGVAFMHSHLGPGWQNMSNDDVIAERDRLAGAVAGHTQLPLVGLTWGTDQSWSGRFWLRAGRRQYVRRWASTVRSVGHQLRITYHPQLRSAPLPQESQVATRSVWGKSVQQDLVRVHVGIIGLGSVGSIVAEGLARTGIQSMSFIDYDVIEQRNLDRTFGATSDDVRHATPKVDVAARVVESSHTAPSFRVETFKVSVVEPEGLSAALDCDILICCVDRPWPRDVLNRLAYFHLIPVIDGGILAKVSNQKLIHVDWRIHTVGPGYACLYCLGALRRSDAALDRDGNFDDPDYLQGLSEAEKEHYARRNVFAFSLSVASHEILQLVGLVSGNQRIGGSGPQRYSAYPGEMTILSIKNCEDNCDIPPLIASTEKLIAKDIEMTTPNKRHKRRYLNRIKVWIKQIKVS